MIIYKDAITGDEMFSDGHPMTLEDDGLVIKIKGKLTTETTSVSESTYGGNKSAEADDDEGADPSSVSGIDVVLANRLVETAYSKKAYHGYAKQYMGMAVDKMKENGASEEEVNKFKEGAKAFVQKILRDFKEYQFFMGESMNPEGGLAYVKWEDETPILYFFKPSLVEEKV